jgi:hypothetical protein
VLHLIAPVLLPKKKKAHDLRVGLRESCAGACGSYDPAFPPTLREQRHMHMAMAPQTKLALRVAFVLGVFVIISSIPKSVGARDGI